MNPTPPMSGKGLLSTDTDLRAVTRATPLSLTLLVSSHHFLNSFLMIHGLKNRCVGTFFFFRPSAPQSEQFERRHAQTCRHRSADAAASTERRYVLRQRK